MAMDQIGLQYYIDLTKLNAGVAAVKSKINILNKSIMAVPKGVSAPISGASAELKKMGITSATTTAQFHKMNFEVADHAKIAKLTRLQMKELEGSMISSGKATAAQSHQFNRLNKRLEHSSYQVRKQTSAMGDARRAQERWGAGFKYMMLSQTAWIASGAIIFGVITGITKALREFLDFNQGLVDAAAITQATSAGYKRMEIAAISAFKSSTMGIKETTEALKILGQAGMDATDAAIALETVYKVTTATGGGTTEVVKFLTTAINVWKLSAEDAAKVGNILGAALNYSKLEVEDLGVTFNYVASIAKTTGMSITELAATMAVMANAGIKASTIGTGLRGVISKLISSSPKLEKELEKVKLKFEDVSLTSHTLMEALETLSKAGFDLKNIFTGLRRREAAALNVMLEQGVERFKLMTAALKDTTAIEVMFERSMKGMKNQLILTGHQIQAVLIDMLKVSQPIIIGTAKAVQALVSALRDLAPILIGVGASLALWKIGAMIATAATAKLAAGFTAATVSAGLFIKVLNLLKFHPILIGLTLLIGAFTAGKLIVDKFTKSTKELTDELNEEIDDLRKLQILLLDVNRTDKEKLRILDDYAKKFEFLLPLLDQQNISIDKTVKLISKENKVRGDSKIAIKEVELAIKDEQLARAEALKDQEHWLMRFALITGPDEAYLKKLREERDLLADRIAIMKGEKEAPKIIYDVAFELSTDMQKALDKLEYEAMSAKEQAKTDLEEGLRGFEITELSKTKFLIKQTEKRKEINLKARTKMMEAPDWATTKIILAERTKALAEIDRFEAIELAKTGLLRTQTEKRKEIDLKARAEMIEDPAATKTILAERDKALAALDGQLRAQELLIAAYNDKIKEINEEADEDRRKLIEKALKDIEKRVKFREKAETKAIKTTGKLYKNYEKLQNDLAKKLIDGEEDGYEKRLKIWNWENVARQKKYTDLLKMAEDYYEKLISMAQESPVFKVEAERIAKLIIKIRELQAKLKTIEEKEEPYKLRDMGAGALKGLRKYRDLIKDEYKIWEDMAYESAMAMQNSFSDLFFDAMMGDLHTLSDYWKSFTTSIRCMIANMASMWLMFSVFNMGGIGLASHQGGLIKAHSGGLIKKMHSGGQNLKSDETIRILKDHEYVIKDSSVRSIGVAALDFANKTGRLPQASQPQQVIHKHYTYVYAIDSESMDLALRKRGAGAIGDISLNAAAYARGKQDPRVSGRGRY